MCIGVCLCVYMLLCLLAEVALIDCAIAVGNTSWVFRRVQEALSEERCNRMVEKRILKAVWVPGGEQSL